MGKSLIVFSVVAFVVVVLYFVAKDNAEFGGRNKKNISDQNKQENCSYVFQDYKNSEKFVGNPAGVDFSSRPEARKFYSVITNGAKFGPNFAGHYTVVSWGCGTNCQGTAIVDANTGRINEYGLLSTNGLDFRRDSNLLIVNPAKNYPSNSDPNLPNIKSEYYNFSKGKLALMCTRVATGIKENEKVCVQVVTQAQNPITGEVKEFGTPCDIPMGWNILPQ